MWPEKKCQMKQNPDFTLMEDGATSHSAHLTCREREKQGIPKFECVSNSPDFNLVERIWIILKRRIQRCRASERVTTVTEMKRALIEEWEKITVEETNAEIAKFPTIISRCLKVNGGNNYHT